MSLLWINFHNGVVLVKYGLFQGCRIFQLVFLANLNFQVFGSQWKTWISYLHTTHGFVVTICLKPCVFTLAFWSLNPLDLSSTTRMTRLERSPRHLFLDLWYFTSRFQRTQRTLECTTNLQGGYGLFAWCKLMLFGLLTWEKLGSYGTFEEAQYFF